MSERIRAAQARLDAAKQKCQQVPLWLPWPLYKRRLDAAMREWRQANLDMFDAEVEEEL